MVTTGNKFFLDKARGVGREIVCRFSQLEDGGTFQRGDYVLHARGSGTVFSGDLVPLLVLLELSRRDGDMVRLQFVKEKIVQQAMAIERLPGKNFSFYEGQMGIVYALLELDEVSADSGCRALASTIARKCTTVYLNYPYTSDSLFQGRAGTLLVLMQLHSLTQEEWILTAMNLFAGKIIRNSIHRSSGLSWAVNNATAAETGWAYGAAGIGYVFLELGSYVENPVFYHFAGKAFQYEDHDPSYLRGTMGIGLARLRAWEVLADSGYREDIRLACGRLDLWFMEQASSMSIGEKVNYGLFLAEVYQVLPEAWQRQRMLEIANGLSESEALSLEELAGMMQLFLQVDGYSPCAFLPRLRRKAVIAPGVGCLPYLSLTRMEAQRQLLEKDFCRTISLLEYIDAAYMFRYYLETPMTGSLIGGFVEFVSRLVPTMEVGYGKRLEDIFRLERTKQVIAGRYADGKSLHNREARAYQAASRVLVLDEQRFLQVVVSRYEDVTIVVTMSNPNIDPEDDPPEVFFTSDVPTTTLLKPSARKIAVQEIRKSYDIQLPKYHSDRVREMRPGKIEERVMVALVYPRRIGDLVEELTGSASNGVRMPRLAVIDSIRELLSRCILKPESFLST